MKKSLARYFTVTAILLSYFLTESAHALDEYRFVERATELVSSFEFSVYPKLSKQSYPNAACYDMDNINSAPLIIDLAFTMLSLRDKSRIMVGLLSDAPEILPYKEPTILNEIDNGFFFYPSIGAHYVNSFGEDASIEIRGNANDPSHLFVKIEAQKSEHKSFWTKGSHVFFCEAQ